MRTRKTISILLVFALLLTAGAMNPADVNQGGGPYVKAAEDEKFGAEDGDQAGTTVDQPYQISNAAQLRRLYKLIQDDEKNKNGKLYSECYYVLLKDITVLDGTVAVSADGKKAAFVDKDGKSLSVEQCKEKKWNPILHFNGHFDGKGFSISGLYIEGDPYTTGSGFFDYLDQDAIVQNLTIKNSIITKTGNYAPPFDTFDFIKGVSWYGTVNGCTQDTESCYIGELASEWTPAATKVPATEAPKTEAPATTVPATEAPKTEAPATTVPATEVPKTEAPKTETPATKAPVIQLPSPEPTQAASTDAPEIKKGAKVTVGGVSYEAVGKNEISYNGSKNVKKGAVTVPDTVNVNGVSCKVTTIGKNAFAGNKKIKKVTLGKNVKTIGKGAFKNCTSLTSVKFPANVKTVSDQAFYNCKKLKQVKLPAAVKTIGKATFKNCVSMKNFSIGAKTSKKTLYAANSTSSEAKKISIGASAMENCIKLKQIVINAQVRRIGNAAFRQCKSLADIFVYSMKLQYVGKRALKGVSNCKISVPKKKMRPYTRLFRNKGQGKKVVMAKLA